MCFFDLASYLAAIDRREAKLGIEEAGEVLEALRKKGARRYPAIRRALQCVWQGSVLGQQHATRSQATTEALL